MRFAEKVERLCERRNWNRAELARRCGVSKTTVGYWFDDRRRPFDDRLLCLARLFDVPADYLIDDAADAPPAPELTDDDRLILRTVRALGLTADEVIRRLHGPARVVPARAIARRRDPRTGLVEYFDPDTGEPVEPPAPLRPGQSG